MTQTTTEQTTEATVTWRELLVTDAEGQHVDTLGWVAEQAPANLDTATIEGGRIVAWPQYFIAAPGEEPDWDTPRGPVDWAGFVDRLAEVCGWPADAPAVGAMR